MMAFLHKSFSLGLLSTLLLTNTLSAQNFLECDEERMDVDPAVIEAYQQYEAQAMREQNNYLRSIKSVWSADSVLTDTPDEWVEYGNDYLSRSVVDFKRGVATVEIAVKPGEQLSDAELNQRLVAALGRLMTTKGTTCPYLSVVDSAQALSEKPVMNGLIDLSKFAVKDPAQKPSKGRKHFGSNSKDMAAPAYLKSNEGLTDEQSMEVASSVVSQLLNAGKKSEKESPLLLFPRDGSDPISNGTTCSIISLEVDLVSANLNKNAALYKDFVESYAKQYDIDKALVFAVMEQESHFNPKATSHAPAYGLMQLVPKTAGLASYRYVFKKDVIPTSNYLYVPRQNVQLGTAYLRILYNRFKSVEDEDCRRLCVIAAYNTGAGNVSRAFTGGTNLTNALPLINKMNYKKLFKHLTVKLNSSEARNYVSKVQTNWEKYYEMFNE